MDVPSFDPHPADARLLNERRALVTGADSGIGQGIAYELAAHGAAVAINHVDDGATAQAMAISPSHVQLPSSIFVSGSISPPLFVTATIAAMRRRTRDEEGSRIACDRNVRGGVLALAGLRRPRRFTSDVRSTSNASSVSVQQVDLHSPHILR